MVGCGNAKRTVQNPLAAQLTAVYSKSLRLPQRCPRCCCPAFLTLPRIASPRKDKNGELEERFSLRTLSEHHKAEKLYVEGCLCICFGPLESPGHLPHNRGPAQIC